MNRDRRRVVVTGMGTLNPIAKSLDEYWSSLLEGKSGAAPIEGFSSERLTTKFACQVRDWDPLDHMDRKLVQRSARFTHLAVAASRMAVDDSGLDMAKEDPFRVGIEMGTGIGGFDMMTNMSAEFLIGPQLGKNMLNLGIYDQTKQALAELEKFSGVRFDGMLVRILARELKVERSLPNL